MFIMDTQFELLELIKYQKAYITSLKKELSETHIEIGILKSEIQENKHNFNIHKEREINNLKDEVNTLRKENKLSSAEKKEIRTSTLVKEAQAHNLSLNKEIKFLRQQNRDIIQNCLKWQKEAEQYKELSKTASI